MKRVAAALLSGVIAVAILAGCGGASAPQAGHTNSATPYVDKIKKDGKLVIGTSPDYPPFESLDNNNNVTGFDIDIMNEVAKKLGVKLEIVQIGFDGLIPALNARKVDIMAAGVSVTDERKQAVDFSKPYIVGSNAIVVNKDITKPIKTLQDLTGLKVATAIGTVQSDAVKAVSGATVKEYNLFTDAAQSVSSKQADAMYLATAVAKSFVSADPKLKMVAELSAQDTAYALRKDTPDLTQAVSATIDDLQKSGKMDELVKKWFK